MNSPAWPAALAVLALLVPGCQAGPAASGTKTEWFRICESSEECPDDSDCLCGVCTAECASDSDCPVGLCSIEEGTPESCTEEELQKVCVASSEIPFSTLAPVELSVPGATGIDDPSITEDRLELYFAVNGHPDATDLARIWSSTRSSITAPWEEPALVPELNDLTGADSMPGVTADGLSLYFVRDPAVGVRRLYFSTRPTRDAAWAPPEPVAFNNDNGAGDSPSATSDGLLLSWSRRDQTTSLSAIFLAQRATTDDPWELLGALNGLSEEGIPRYEPWLADDGLTLFYRCNKDLCSTWRTHRDESFGTETLVEELNTGAWESDPWLSQDTRFIMFSSDQDDVWSIYEATR